ncbi:MAG: carbon-nitrogen hydrolase family protein [Tepidisphaeraceae bacterium]|jgi:predicted amidohydrolase
MSKSTMLIPLLFFCFAAAAAELAPDGWRFSSPREEIAPRAWVVRGPADAYGLALAGTGDESVNGKWTRRIPVTAGQHVIFSARYESKDIQTPRRSLIASVLWFDEKGGQVEQAEFPSALPGTDPQGLRCMAATYPVPKTAREARVELQLRWAPNGQVIWRDVSLTQATPPTSRPVKVASINHRPRGTKTPQENLQQFAKFIDEAGAAKADIICLPEGITVCGTGLKYAAVAEAVPGPSAQFLGECAARNKAYIVAGLYERDGKGIYNTSVLIGRDGRLAGKYRKVCLPREEIDGGITPGTAYPVFDTDFGRVGMMICWDLSYPEVARELSARGAEVIFMPIWGGNETLAQARAIENQVYLVASGYDFRTAIYDKSGQTIARSRDASGVIYADIDLGQRLLWPWLGDWRSRIWLEGPARTDRE